MKVNRSGRERADGTWQEGLSSGDGDGVTGEADRRRRENSVNPEAKQEETLRHWRAPHLRSNRRNVSVTSSKPQVQTRLRHDGERSHSRNSQEVRGHRQAE